jgi:hypothetical protein
MLIIKFTDSYGHQEEIRFAEFETLSETIWPIISNITGLARTSVRAAGKS